MKERLLDSSKPPLPLNTLFTWFRLEVGLDLGNTCGWSGWKLEQLFDWMLLRDILPFEIGTEMVRRCERIVGQFFCAIVTRSKKAKDGCDGEACDGHG